MVVANVDLILIQQHWNFIICKIKNIISLELQDLVFHKMYLTKR